MKLSEKFQVALLEEKPLQIIGVLNPYVALLAKNIGFRALYVSGAAVANFSHGIPDIGKTTLEDVTRVASSITAQVDLPLLVDLDTGFEIEQAIRSMILAKVACVHIEDQTEEKRCGHLDGKTIISIEEMAKKIETAVKTRDKSDLLIMARIDAFAEEGLAGTIERGLAYLEAGADMLFPEALPTLEDFIAFKEAVEAPVLANLTEFGKTPLFTTEELAKADIDMALYPLSIVRAMNKTAGHVLAYIREEGTQDCCMSLMQTREELYETLNYNPEEKNDGED